MQVSIAQAQSNPPKVEATYGQGNKSFKLATGSPGELGLLQELGEAFDKKEGARLVWIKAGSGASLNLLKTQQAQGREAQRGHAQPRLVGQGGRSRRNRSGHCGAAFQFAGAAPDLP